MGFLGDIEAVMLLSISHITVYRYSQPVRLGAHRLMVRPLEGHDVQIRSSTLRIAPAYRLRWIQDIFGNSIALVDFLEPASEMRVESAVTVEQYNNNPFDFVVDPYATELPFQYLPDDQVDVAPYLHRMYPGEDTAIRNWVRPFLGINGRARTMEFLTALNKSVPMSFNYRRREEPGVQSPGETLQRRSGSCRDFALLLIETARAMGLAARFVSGYLCQAADGVHEAALGATHAWAEIYLPGAGWKGFDPTCGILAADSHVRVAVTRLPAQAVPVSGIYDGTMAYYRGLQVLVEARVIG
jgi:transglutaminase-like putative cysteine protease